MATKNETLDVKDNKLSITRVMNAPRQLVWEAWTDPKHIIHWWGPVGFTNSVIQFDFKEGGIWRFTMHGPDGRDYPNKIQFLKIESPKHIAYRHVEDTETEAVHFFVTVDFIEEGDKTQITMQMICDTPEELQFLESEYGAIGGAVDTMDRLRAHLKVMSFNSPVDLPVVVERTYNASASKVWSALTNRDEMQAWYFELEDFQPEVGFEFSFTGTTEDNRPYLHLCKITEVIPEKRLSYTWKYDGLEGNSLVTFELFPEGKNTRVRLTHSGLETFPANNPDMAPGNFFAGWTSILNESLKNYLDK